MDLVAPLTALTCASMLTSRRLGHNSSALYFKKNCKDLDTDRSNHALPRHSHHQSHRRRHGTAHCLCSSYRSIAESKQLKDLFFVRVTLGVLSVAQPIAVHYSLMCRRRRRRSTALYPASDTAFSFFHPRAFVSKVRVHGLESVLELVFDVLRRPRHCSLISVHCSRRSSLSAATS